MPVPTFVMDQLLTVPAGACRLATGTWLRCWQRIIKPFDVSKWPRRRIITVLPEDKVLPVALPTILSDFERGLATTSALGKTCVDREGCGVMRGWLDRDTTVHAYDFSSLGEAPARDDNAAMPCCPVY